MSDINNLIVAVIILTPIVAFLLYFGIFSKILEYIESQNPFGVIYFIIDAKEFLKNLFGKPETKKYIYTSAWTEAFVKSIIIDKHNDDNPIAKHDFSEYLKVLNFLLFRQRSSFSFSEFHITIGRDIYIKDLENSSFHHNWDKPGNGSKAYKIFRSLFKYVPYIFKDNTKFHRIIHDYAEADKKYVSERIKESLENCSAVEGIRWIARNIVNYGIKGEKDLFPEKYSKSLNMFPQENPLLRENISKKYEILKDETIKFRGKTLYRIRSLKNFSDVIKGEKGGWIETDYNLVQSDNAWIYGNAKVYEKAWVSENAKVMDNAKVYGHSHICGNAVISGNAEIYENADVYDNAQVSDYSKVYGEKVKIRDNAKVSDNATIYGNSRVSGNTEISGNAIIFGFSRISGKAKISEGATISGNAKISGDSVICGVAKIKDKNINSGKITK